jgi:polyhydroxyalkanoate synthesis repressor PhaR
MDAERLIKKYPNRRLYDTAKSAYATLEDIRRLVMEGVAFKVVDAKTDEDITRTILLQIILEQEEQGRPIFTSRILEQIIRTYGDATQDFMTRYLEDSMALFFEQQQLIRRQMSSALQSGPLSIFGELAQQNLRLWQSFQDAMRAGTGEGKGGV